MFRQIGAELEAKTDLVDLVPKQILDGTDSNGTSKCVLANSIGTLV